MDNWILARIMEDLSFIKQKIEFLEMASNANYHKLEELKIFITENIETVDETEETQDSSNEPDPFADLQQDNHKPIAPNPIAGSAPKPKLNISHKE